ncbi:hypothetical protein EXT46_15925 [Pseudoalteromonas sp. CO325X]|uniref:hypothetical protein n=1 Tax=Pseudoalteromonas sp. CO325X TaxID=1777262 RepID=UPI001022B81D|nr:hypothetical protein [Pseudoalteromonas sp. CO325X]RZF77620.1 hypothetical protein EXT46_15925 [Pseudoalteromonas sp. CO325X]
MHPDIADILAIQPVRLRSSDATAPVAHVNSANAEPLNNTVAQDILRCLPQGAAVYISDVSSPQVKGLSVYLPAANLAVAQKQALWQQLSNVIDEYSHASE